MKKKYKLQKDEFNSRMYRKLISVSFWNREIIMVQRVHLSVYLGERWRERAASFVQLFGRTRNSFEKRLDRVEFKEYMIL